VSLTIEKISTGDSRLELGDTILQTPFWGKLKGAFGWRPHHFLLNGEYPLLVLTRPLIRGYRLGYIPWGPGAPVDSGDWKALETLSLDVAKVLGENLLFLRFDPPWDVPVEEIHEQKKGAFHRASMDIQPPSTTIMDITGDDDALMAGMKKKTRYNIRLSEKKGVTVRQGAPGELDTWYAIYEETAKRDKIALHEKEYYQTIFNLAAGSEGDPDIRLYLAEIDGNVEAGIVVSHQGKRATYLYGASSNNKRNAMPAYGLQWTAIKAARDAGCESYDFYGIPPMEDPNHPMAGLYRFKVGFGGAIVHRPGSWDLPFKPGLYKVYRLLEKMRTWYYRKFRKR